MSDTVMQLDTPWLAQDEDTEYNELDDMVRKYIE
jgi:hypothetical protein